MLSSRTKIDFVIVVVYPSVSNATESTGPELVRASNGKSRVSTSRVLAALVGSRACDVSIIDHIYVASQTNESTVRRILLRKRSTKMDMLRNGSITLVARAASFLSLLPTSRSIFKIIWLVTGAEEYSILISSHSHSASPSLPSASSDTFFVFFLLTFIRSSSTSVHEGKKEKKKRSDAQLLFWTFF